MSNVSVPSRQTCPGVGHPDSWCLSECISKKDTALLYGNAVSYCALGHCVNYCQLLVQ